MARFQVLSLVLAILNFCGQGNASPVNQGFLLNTSPGSPFDVWADAIQPRQPQWQRRGFDIFRRQGNCPTLTIACDAASSVCCDYDKTCCGTGCCESGYLCATTSSGEATCCPMSSSTCGTTSNNPCADQTQYPCSNGLQFCCATSDAVCYVDSANNVRCGSGSDTTTPTTTTPTPIPTTTSTPDTTPITTPDSTSTTVILSRSTSISIVTSPAAASTTTPPATPSASSFHSPLTPGVIGGIVGGAAGVIIILIAAIWCFCHHKRKSRDAQKEAARIREHELALATLRYNSETKLKPTVTVRARGQEAIAQTKQKYEICKQMHAQFKAWEAQKRKERKDQMLVKGATKVGKMALKMAGKHLLINLFAPGASLALMSSDAYDILDALDGVSDMPDWDCLDGTDVLFPDGEMPVWDGLDFDDIRADGLNDDLDTLYAQFRDANLPGLDFGSDCDTLFNYGS